MSQGIPPNVSNDLAQLLERAVHLRRLVCEQAVAARKRRKVLLGVGIGTLVVSSLLLANLTRLSFALDAETLGQLGRAEIEKKLPDSRKSLKSYLEREAPNVASQAITAIAASIPSLRVMIISELTGHFGAVTETFERKLTADLKDVIQSTKADIDRAMPESSEVEKTEKLVKAVSDKFRAQAEAAFHSLYPEYSAEMEQILIYLEHLRTQPEDKLTPKEKVHKEIIETILRVTIQAHEDRGRADW